MTPQELINSLSGEDGIAMVGYNNILVLYGGELYDIEDVVLEDESVILRLNDN